MSGNHAVYQRNAERQKRDELILSHLPLVKHVIGRLITGLAAGIDVENLESAGVLGLVEAAAKFDPTRNAQFKTFAYIRVRGAILDELRRNSPLPQHVSERVTAVRKAYRTLPHPVTVEALAAATGFSIDDVADTLAAERFAKMVSWDQTADAAGAEPAMVFDTPDADMEQTETVDQLTKAIESLPQQERTAVTLYYKEDLRLREIGEIMGLSTSRISRLLSKATFELGESLKSYHSVA